MAGEIPPYDKTAFGKFPESQAVERLLLREKKYDLLQNTLSVAVNTNGEFGSAVIRCRLLNKDAKIKVYLLKDGDSWVASSKLPTHKDCFGLFYLVAEQYFQEKYPQYEGIGYQAEKLENNDHRKRRINFTWSEQVNGNWQDHPLSLIYEYDKKAGWHITGEAPVTETPLQTGTALPADGGATLAQPNPLHIAVSMAAISPANESAAIKLIKESADVNIQDDLGRTPLHMLCYGCLSPNVVQALIAAGADVNLRSNDGYPPLELVNMMMATGQVTTCAQIKEMLVQAGAQ